MGLSRAPAASARRPEVGWADYLRSIAVPRDLIDQFIGGPGWARFDAEMGYVLRDSALPWGVGGSLAIETFDAAGGREGLRFPGRHPRIATYGDEFTEGIQVGDAETWQEYLAGHLREPVANYGVGGYGVYQAYRRMRREESARHGAVIVLTISGPAMNRSMTRSHWVTTAAAFWDEYSVGLPVFHGNPWPSIELDLTSGFFIERENPLRTPGSLYRMCDPAWMAAEFEDDLGSWLHAHSAGLAARPDRARLTRLAELLGCAREERGEDTRVGARRLLVRYGQAATIWTLDRVREFAAARGSKLLVVLALGAGSETIAAPDRRGRGVIDHLRRSGVELADVDTALAASTLRSREHLADYLVAGNLESVRHFNARGNHFLAYAITEQVVALLERKPAPYRVERDEPRIERRELSTDHVGMGESLAPMLRELADRFAEPWNADSLAQLAMRSKSALYRDFLSIMRMSPMAYVKQLRLEESARLLIGSEATVGAIAELVGIGDQFHLSREFSRFYGISPTVYRRRHREPSVGGR